MLPLPAVISIEALCARVHSEDGAYATTPFCPMPWLLFDASSPQVYPDVQRWLALQTVPSIAVCARPTALSACADVVVNTPAAAQVLLANIAHAPIAASILVQLLRHSQGLSLESALMMESTAYASLQAGPEFQRWLATRPPMAPPPSEAGPTVDLSHADGILSVRLNRPGRSNSMSMAMRDALNEAFALAQKDPSVERVQVSGRGSNFSSGGDLFEFGTAPSPAESVVIRAHSLPARSLLPIAHKTEFSLHGHCVGAGIELSAFAQRVIAEANTQICLPEIRFGLIPGAGGCVSLPRRIGRQRSAWLMLSAATIGPHLACNWGLVDGMVPGG